MKILVTGASGFVGSAVIRQLMADGIHTAIASTQRLDADADWSSDLSGVDAVIHCAARVHVMRERTVDPLAEYRKVNVEGTARLAEQAATAGVNRFIFLSSIKVNGEVTAPGKPFTADDLPNPQDAYGVSKHEAEERLRDVARRTGIEVVILRPPLVYGPGAKGNFVTLTKLAASGLPLPLGSIRNQRSMVALDNLVDLVVLCLTHPAAANQTFLVSDDVDLSTPDLIRTLAYASDKRPRLLPFPPLLLRITSNAIGRPGIAQRLCDSLQLDIKKTRTLLKWVPCRTHGMLQHTSKPIHLR